MCFFFFSPDSTWSDKCHMSTSFLKNVAYVDIFLHQESRHDRITLIYKTAIHKKTLYIQIFIKYFIFNFFTLS